MRPIWKHIFIVTFHLKYWWLQRHALLCYTSLHVRLLLRSAQIWGHYANSLQGRRKVGNWLFLTILFLQSQWPLPRLLHKRKWQETLTPAKKPYLQTEEELEGKLWLHRGEVTHRIPWCGSARASIRNQSLRLPVQQAGLLPTKTKAELSANPAVRKAQGFISGSRTY